jgi:hypothetical protein
VEIGHLEQHSDLPVSRHKTLERRNGVLVVVVSQLSAHCHLQHPASVLLGQLRRHRCSFFDPSGRGHFSIVPSDSFVLKLYSDLLADGLVGVQDMMCLEQTGGQPGPGRCMLARHCGHRAVMAAVAGGSHNDGPPASRRWHQGASGLCQSGVAARVRRRVRETR